MEKKPYTPPTITEHGDAVKATKGWGGPLWEITNPKPAPESDIEW
ncbi:MAG TPA: lasso RiPP family leader peptide-containing protein [Longimicrobiales bacterium]